MENPKIKNPLEKEGPLDSPSARQDDISTQFYRDYGMLVQKALAFNRSIRTLSNDLPLYSGRKKVAVEKAIERDKSILIVGLDDIIGKISALAGHDVFLNDEEADLYFEGQKKIVPVSDQIGYERQNKALQRHNEMIAFLLKDLKLDSHMIELLDNRILEKAAERKKSKEEEEKNKTATEHEDEKKLLETRKKIETIPDGEKDYFDPEEALQEIRREIFAENFLAPDEKKEKVRSYKEKLMDQKMRIASINQKLEDYLLEKYEFDEKEMLSIFEKEAKWHKLAPYQIERYKLAFEKVKERMRIIDYYEKSFEGKSDKEKYEKIFGFKPEGAVRIEKNRLCFTVWCESPQDYANIFSAGTQGEMKESMQKKADCSGGVANTFTAFPELRGAVIAIKESGIRNTNSVFIHEQKHVLNRIIRPVAEADRQGYLKEGRENFNRPADFEKLKIFFEFRADYIRERAGDELLAYLKDGRPVFDILTTLEEGDEKGGLYDYYKMDESICPVPDDLKGIFSDEKISELRNKYKQRYSKELRKAIFAVSELEEAGFKRDSIVALFQAEDMKHWPKILGRLKQNEHFQQLMAKKAQKKLDEIKSRIMKLTGLIEALVGRTYSDKFFKLFDPKSGEMAEVYEQERAVLQSRQYFLENIIKNAKKYKQAENK